MAQILNGESGPVLSDDAELIQGFLRDCELRRLSDSTIEGYRSSLRIVADFLRRRGYCLGRLDNDSLKEVLRFLVKRGFVYNTLLQYFAALSGFSDYLVWEKITQANPVGHSGKDTLSNLRASTGLKEN